jgi:hypothetical protein
MPNSFDLMDFRYILQAAGRRSATFTVADNAAWAAGTALSPRIFDFEHSLVWESVEDGSIQSMHDGNPPPVESIRSGSFKFKQWLEGGANNTTATTLAALLGSGAVLGGLRNPTAASDAAEASCSTTSIKATSHGMEENEGVLFGAAGDSGGDGRIGFIEDASNANEYDLQIALPGAPAESAVLQNGHTLYVDPSVEQYIDVLFIGSDAGSGATDDPDQFQCIGCACSSLVFGGLAAGEKPYVEMEFMVSDWQWVNNADKATISHTQAKLGGDPVSNAAGGSFVIQDAGTTTRNALGCDELAIEWPINLVKYVDKNYTNDCGGYVKHPAGPPIIRATVYWDDAADMPGLYNDSIGTETAKQVQVQLGRVSTGCVGFYAQRAFLPPLSPSQRKSLEGSTGLELEFRCDNNRQTALSTDAMKLEDASLVMAML